MPSRPLLALLVGLLSVPAHADPVLEDNDLSAALVIGDLDVPTTLAFIGANDFFVLEKNDGQVVRVLNGASSIVLDLDVEFCEERGLLGVAVHPDFATANPKYVYLYYTLSQSGDDEETCNFSYQNRLDRFEWNGTNLVNPMNLDTFPSFVTYHLGGPLLFGPDDKLYGVNGDGEQNNAAQNDEANPTFDDTGVVFRLNDDGSTPTDNPFDSDDDQADPQDRYFAYGIRNSFGLAFDPFSNTLWDTENGEDSNDEVNRIVAGANSGWRDIMGPGMAPAGLVDLPGSSYIPPAYSIQVPVAVTGIAFASENSSLGDAYEGDLFLADYELGQIYDFEVNMARDGLATADKHANNQAELNGFLFASEFEGGIADLEEGPDGDLYVVAIGLGEVWRISAGGSKPVTHDIAITGLKPPSKVTFSPDPKLKTLKLSLQNLGTATETIANQGELNGLVDVTITSLGGTCAGDLPVATLQPPKDGFPFSWEPNKKLSLGLDVAWACINDPAATSKTEDHDDFTLEASADLSALGETDGDAGNDDCPRAAAGDDKGCGKTSVPFRIDLIVK